MVTARELADRMIQDITEYQKNGVIPYNVKSFSELHNYVDANCLGGTDPMLDELSENASDELAHLYFLVMVQLIEDAAKIINKDFFKIIEF